MPELVDMIGRVFGKLTVVQRVGSTPGGHAMWLCECKCGNEKEIPGGRLRNGRTLNCGCEPKTTNERRKLSDLVTLERLREVLSYDPDAGIFRWNVSTSNRVKIGQEAGCPDPRGYVRISIDGKSYTAQRLAWFYVTGEWPVADVDHKNENKSDNRFDNLRPATRPQNMANTGLQKNTPHGFKGVRCLNDPGRNKRYSARIAIDGKTISLGYFMTAEEAGAAYAKAHKAHYSEYSKMDKINAVS